jgi:hypothetical protein
MVEYKICAVAFQLMCHYEHTQARDCLTQQHRNSKDSSVTTKNDCIQNSCTDLTSRPTDYSIWKVIKNLKHGKNPSPPLWTSQGTCARSSFEKARVFAKHLEDVFIRIRQKVNPKKMHVSNF